MSKGEIARLKHDAKRFYIYEYGKGELDGKITISKRIIGQSEMDFIDALESGDIEIENCSDCQNLVPIPGMKVDELALRLLSKIIAGYEEFSKMPVEIKL